MPHEKLEFRHGSVIARAMKLLAALFVGILPVLVFGQTNSLEKISADQAGDYIGKNVIVTGRVAEVHFAEKLVRLNLDKPFPRQPFTAVVFANRTNLFPDLKELKDKAIEVRGVVAEYRSRPEIVISRTNQLVILPSEKK